MTVPDVKLDRVTAELTTRELRVVVPAGTLKDPLDTVTFPPVEGLRIILDVELILRLKLVSAVTDPTWTIVIIGEGVVCGSPRITIPEPPEL